MFKIIPCNFRGKHEGERGQLERVQNIPLSRGFRGNRDSLLVADRGKRGRGGGEATARRVREGNRYLGDSRSWDATPRRPGKLHVGVADLPPGLLNLITANFARAKRSPIFVYSLCSRLDPRFTLATHPCKTPTCRACVHTTPFVARPLFWIKVCFAVLNYRRINFQFIVVTLTYRIDSTVSIWE